MLVSVQDIAKAYSGRELFRGISLAVGEGERVGLFGPNGAGKSTLLKILSGGETPDAGTVTWRKGAKIAWLTQEDRFTRATVFEEVVGALDGEHLEAHEKEVQASIVLTKIGFGDGAGPAMEAELSKLSGGWRKRAALARELVREPDLLLLDEPTNHLDLEGILWLEGFLQGSRIAYVVVTHDRFFLENVTNRIVEINPIFTGGFLSVPGKYSDFLERRDVVLEAQAKEQQALSQIVKQEIAWLRTGPKARRTKRKSRIKDAHDKIADLADMRSRSSQQDAVDIAFSATDRKTKKLIAVHNVSKALGEGETRRVLMDKVSLTLTPGMKLGVLGPNGSGKSTFLKVLTGQMMPDAGTVKQANDLRIVFFDQQRQQLERKQLLKHALAPDSDSVVYNGELIHVSSYAKRFLFRFDQLDRPVGELSGGEQARVLIARLMLSAADVLVLDEPTNDLDIPSLEVLEESLEVFPGALVLVTHDRFMLDRLATDILGLDGYGGTGLFTDYDQYEAWREAQELQRRAPAIAAAAEKREESAAVAAKKSGKRALTLKEQKEWETMEATIHAAEADVERWQKAMGDPAVMADRSKMAAACDGLAKGQTEVERLYARWAELESKMAGEA